MFHVKRRRVTNDGHGLHKAAVDYLARQYPQTVAAVQRHGVTWNTTAHGTYTPFVGQRMKIKRVTIPGEPDIWVAVKGRLMKIELKDGKASARKAQRERRDVLRAGRVPVTTCHDVNDVQATVDAWRQEVNDL